MSCEDTAKKIIEQISIIGNIIGDLKAFREDKLAEIEQLIYAIKRGRAYLSSVSPRRRGGNRKKCARKTKKLTNRVKY
jgi:hypothetical protein